MKLELEIIPTADQKIPVRGEGGTTLRAVTKMEHDGVELRWSCPLIERASYHGEFDLFEQINAFWADRPKETQDKIFKIYLKIYEILDFLEDTNARVPQLQQLINQLFELHPLEDVRHFVYFNCNLIDPATMGESYVESGDNIYTRGRTYTRPDYHWLVALGVTLRVMIPIWGEFINKTSKEIGTIWKEYKAVDLIAHSTLQHSPAMGKLYEYIESFIPEDRSIIPTVMEGLSSKDFPRWVLSLVLVRRLCLGDVRGYKPEFNLVTDIHRFIIMRLRGQEKLFGGTIREKSLEGNSSGDEENRLSWLESYRERQTFSEGDVVVLTHLTSDAHEMARRLCPDIDPKLVDISLESVHQVSDKAILRCQTTLIQWVISRVVPIPGVDRAGEKRILQTMAAVQALLWHRKYYDLAGLVSAVAQDTGSVMRLSSAGPRMSITKKQMETLETLYPLTPRSFSRGRAPKRVNTGVRSIETLADEFSEHSWRLTLPQEWVASLTGTGVNRRFDVPGDLRVKLADLTISLVTRNFFNHVQPTEITN